MDFYAASGMSLLWCTFFQTVAICWIFGGKKIYDCIEQMIGFRINWYWYICWMCTAPAFMIVSKLPINKMDFHIDLELNLIFWMLLNNKKTFFTVFIRILLRKIYSNYLRKNIRISVVGRSSRILYQWFINDLGTRLRYLFSTNYRRDINGTSSYWNHTHHNPTT